MDFEITVYLYCDCSCYRSDTGSKSGSESDNKNESENKEWQREQEHHLAGGRLPRLCLNAPASDLTTSSRPRNHATRSLQRPPISSYLP